MAIINNERKIGSRFAIVLEVQKAIDKPDSLCKGCIFKTPHGCRCLGQFDAGYCASVVRKINNDDVIFKQVGVLEIE